MNLYFVVKVHQVRKHTKEVNKIKLYSCNQLIFISIFFALPPP